MISPFSACDFAEHGLQPLLELAAIFRAGDQRAHVERHQPLFLQRFRHVAIDDAQRQAFGNRRLADARFADQHRIVLGAAREDLDGAADLVVTADDRVELAFAGFRRQVTGIFLQGVEALLGIGAIGRAALAHVVDDLVQLATGETPAFFSVWAVEADCSMASACSRRSTVTKLSPAFLAASSAVENTLASGCDKIDGAVATRDLGDACKGGVIAEPGFLRIATGARDQRRGHALVVVEQYLQHMFGCKLLMSVGECVGLRRLQETAHAFGIFLDIHGLPPRCALPI